MQGPSAPMDQDPLLFQPLQAWDTGLGAWVRLALLGWGLTGASGFPSGALSLKVGLRGELCEFLLRGRAPRKPLPRWPPSWGSLAAERKDGACAVSSNSRDLGRGPRVMHSTRIQCPSVPILQLCPSSLHQSCQVKWRGPAQVRTGVSFRRKTSRKFAKPAGGPQSRQ